MVEHKHRMPLYTIHGWLLTRLYTHVISFGLYEPYIRLAMRSIQRGAMHCEEVVLRTLTLGFVAQIESLRAQ